MGRQLDLSLERLSRLDLNNEGEEEKKSTKEITCPLCLSMYI